MVQRFEVCSAANGWDGAKKLLSLPTLLGGRAYSLGEADMDNYDNFKAAFLLCLSPDTDEDRMVAQEKLSLRKF